MAKVRTPQILLAAAVSAGLIAPALAAGPAKHSAAPARTASIAAGNAATLSVAYKLRFWEIPFGHTSYHGIFAHGTYQVSSHFETSGIVSVFWRSVIDAGASGNVRGHAIAPYIYNSYATRGDHKTQRVKLTYHHDGPPQLLATPPYNTKKYPVTPRQQEAGVDPMSAITLIISGLRADPGNPCGTVAPVFDGRRRYNIEFTYVKDETVKLDNGLYAGMAHLCRLRYHQIAGYKPKVLHNAKARPPIYALFVDIPDAGAPLGHYVLPVKLWAETKWGTVSAELSALKTGENKVAGG